MNEPAGKPRKITISKLDAARRQLQTAISLWAIDGDEVSIHTLAYAAYEIIHSVSKKRNSSRTELLFDSAFIHEDSRANWNKLIRQSANFFKHADRDPEEVVDFLPLLSEGFIRYGIIGLQECGERIGPEESAYLLWEFLHFPRTMTIEGQDAFQKGIPVEQQRELRKMSKADLFAAIRTGRINVRWM